MSNVSGRAGSMVRTVTSRLSVGVVTAVVTTVVVAGGIAWASVPNNSVNSAKIVNNTIRSEDIRNGAVQGIDIKNGTIGNADLAPAVTNLLHPPDGVVIVETLTTPSVNGDTSVSGSVLCPPGTNVIGGGGRALSVDMVMETSEPLPDQGRWYVRWGDVDGATFGTGFQGRVYAVCSTIPVAP